MTRPLTARRAVCPHDCPDTCSMLIGVEEGRVSSVRGNPDHPPTQGVLCTKVARYAERVHHRERLLQPMRRVGRKGEGRFEPIGWDEALALAAQRLSAVAARCPEAILPYSYSGTLGLVQSQSISARFFNVLGASRLDRTICAAAGAAALKHTYGASVGMLPDFIEESRLILIWGSNPVTSSLHFWTRAQEAKRRGARLVAIDPYRSLTAEKCHEHIAIQPGTDGAFALGMIHVLHAEGLVDLDYVERHALGYEALLARAADYPPETVAGICGVPAAQLIALAREYGRTKPAAIRLNYGMQRSFGGGNAVRAIACLPALVGAWRDRAGGLMMSTSGYAPVDRVALERPDLTPGWPAAAPRLVNMNTLGDILTMPEASAHGPRVDALVVYNSNPAAVAPDSSKVIAGLSREDLFTVVMEHFQTDTADYADLLLPATTQLEHLDVHLAYGHTYLMLNEPAIPPQGEARPNTEIFRGLARAMGLPQPELYESDEALARMAFKWSDPKMGERDWDAFRRDGWIKLTIPEAPFAAGGFPTPSGKCEFYSAALALAGQDPVPDYLPPRESTASSPALAERFALTLISSPARNFLNSTFVNVDSLRAAEKEPHLDIHPLDAAERAIKDGERVSVFNERGAVVVKARVTDKARPGVVVSASIWWRKLSPHGGNVNDLTSQALTDLGGSATFYDCLVDVKPWKEQIEYAAQGTG